MSSFLSQIGQMLSEPLSLFLNSYNHSPIIAALLLGLIGAVAPCQLTGNISAITLYGNRTIQKNASLGIITSFIAGKVVVYSIIGLFAWLFGQAFETALTTYFPLFRKGIGPLLIFTGLVLMGVLKLKFLNRITSHMPLKLMQGKFGSFLLGASFAIAFCPTMFVIFFVWLMPIVASSSYGLALPAVFGIATTIPLLIVLYLIWYFDVKGLVMKKSMKIGRLLQQIAGVLLIIVGLFDTITYWG
ncbi:sulfite exporter TauE/SafE family protein [Metasolibacillus sp. FSL H7-0170]|uniref:cytochrome c biogenesis CcdA family protein n=1 Tax=Metasolibacillus TaxID=2703677 RepID=UPI000D3D9D66|nr:sulfite exporter TauE/SafE family protein [Metasolibacillus fluoroglycofenilyticus]